jgi:hypothetical protein
MKHSSLEDFPSQAHPIAAQAPQLPSIPASLRLKPATLDICEPLASIDELESATRIRNAFSYAGYGNPWIHDIVRAFRILKGMAVYVEVGTFDRGNLAYASTLLSDNALLIGIDITSAPDKDAQLRSFLKPSQTYISIVGDSRSALVAQELTQTLNGRFIDAAFIDGDHTAAGVASDLCLIEQHLNPLTGLLLFHDALWTGNTSYAGGAEFLASLSALDPLYIIDGSRPIHRYLPACVRAEIWGTVALLRAADQAWRQGASL